MDEFTEEIRPKKEGLMEEEMKNKEFKRRVEELGYFINEYTDYYQITGADKNTIAEINKTIFLQLSTDHYQWDKLSEIDKKELFDLLEEYAKTPIEDREEEKKFYLRHKFLTLGCVNTIFTLKEIEEIKKKFDTDLADFELVEVEE